MRRLLINGWNLVLIVLVVWGLMAALVAALWSFAPTLVLPGALWITVLVAAEALTTQRIAVRERQSLSEQWQLRSLELVLLLVIVRLWSLWTDPRPIIAQISPWVRDPLVFFSLELFAHGVFAFLVWALATALGRQILVWSAESLTLTPVERQTILRGQLDAEQADAVRRFDHLLLWIVGSTVALGVFALRGQSRSLALLGQLPGLAVWGTFGAVLGSLWLHSAAKLRQITERWQLDGAVIDPGVTARWSRTRTVLLFALLIAGPLLGTLALVAPPPPLVPVVNAILLAFTFLGAIILFLIGLALLPFAWLISLLRGSDAPPAPSLPDLVAPQLTSSVPPDRPLAPGLIFWGCLLLLVGLAILRYVQQRADLMAWLRRWRVSRWLLAALGGWLADARDWLALARTTVRRRLQRRHTAPRPHLGSPNAQTQLRALYRRMQRAGAARGVVHRPAETPYEYSAALAQAIPPAEPDVAALTETYVAAEYGPQPPTSADLRLGLRLWQRVRHWLGSERRRPRLGRKPPRKQPPRS